MAPLARRRSDRSPARKMDASFNLASSTSSRRAFLQQLGGLAVISQAPGIITSDRARPLIDAGVAAGPNGRDGAIIWAHADRPSRLTVEYSTTASFANAQRVRGTLASPDTGLTAR